MFISSRVQSKARRQRKRSPVVLLLLILLWSVVTGWGLAGVTSAQPTAQNADKIGTVDSIPLRFQLGQELYLQNCAGCHIALPPAVLPTQTWQQILQDSQHYGAQLQPLVDPQRLLVWNYLQTFSRSQDKEEDTPYRVDNSRYFKALHPQVKIARPVRINNCASCHPGASEYNFRSLTPEWENS